MTGRSEPASWLKKCAILLLSMLQLLCLAAQPVSAAGESGVDEDGNIHIANLTVPLSDLMSTEAQVYVRHVLRDRPFMGGPSADQDLKGYRARQDEIMREFLQPMRARYAVKTSHEEIAGVGADVVLPAAGIAPGNAHRVLLNLHGGGFVSGAHSASLVESVPIAATMRIKVVSIDYRMGPEFRFPAASEDVAKVYRELLKHYRPAQIGIYGCSAGGMLTAESMVWFQTHRLPRPGAIGVLCASVGELVAGDSAVLAGPLNGFASPTVSQGFRPRMALGMGYFDGIDANDQLAYPLASPAVLAKFPPTLLISGTRSMEFSAAINSHNALIKAGIDAELHLWDGMFHGFLYNSELPESREAYAVIGQFFDRHLHH